MAQICSMFARKHTGRTRAKLAHRKRWCLASNLGLIVFTPLSTLRKYLAWGDYFVEEIWWDFVHCLFRLVNQKKKIFGCKILKTFFINFIKMNNIVFMLEHWDLQWLCHGIVNVYCDFWPATGIKVYHLCYFIALSLHTFWNTWFWLVSRIFMCINNLA